MDAQEIRMRCLEAAQAATKSPAITPPETIVKWASTFEAYVVGPEEPAPTVKAAKTKAAA